ncbi:MAG: hypothetical protein JO329_22320 [Planctomycetaceae bacterium]|nr:hypothetical protein [Planctomycetaceae bacterium]
MILIGTDAGVYRWFEGCSWPIYHGLQGRSIAGLDSPGDGVLVVLDRDGEVLESVNNGQDWRTIPRPEGSGTPTALAVRGTEEASLVLATRPLGLYLREVGVPDVRAEGSSRRGFLPSLFGRGATSAQAVASDPEAARLAGWTRLGAPSPSPSAGDGSPQIRTLAFGPGSPGTWFAAIPGAGLWRSTDAGTSWRHCAGLPADVNAIRHVPGQPNRAFAATSDGCWVSNDAGQTWEDRSGGLEKARDLGALDVKPGEPDVLLAGAAMGEAVGPEAEPAGGLVVSLFESTNGGKTWMHVRRGFPEDLEGDTIADIRHDPVAPDNVIVALASGELWVTRNGGAYWGPLARQFRAARALCAVG